MRNILMAVALGALTGCASGSKDKIEQPIYSPYSDAPPISSISKIDPKLLFAMADKTGGGQGEYESDSAYNSRSRVIGNFEVCSRVSKSSLEFNSSTGLYRFSSVLINAYDFGVKRPKSSSVGSYLPSINIYDGEYSIGEYVGQNAFGAVAVVDKNNGERVFLAFDEISSERGIISFPRLESVSDFASASPDISLCITSVPEAPYVLHSRSFRTPTITNPKDGHIDSYFYRVKIAGMSLVGPDGRPIPIGLRLNTGYQRLY